MSLEYVSTNIYAHNLRIILVKIFVTAVKIDVTILTGSNLNNNINISDNSKTAIIFARLQLELVKI